MNKKIIMLWAVMAAAAYAGGTSINLDKTTVYSTTGFETKIRDVASNPTIITSREIEEKGYKNISEILREVPGVTIINSGFGEKVDIRGQGSYASIRNVQVMIDGVSVNYLETSHAPTPINTIAVSAIKRIEIIPGGNAVLYGSGTQGGVVNIITKSGKGLRGSLGYQRSSYNGNQLDVSVGHSIDNFDIDLLYSANNSDGYREKSETKTEYLQGKLRYNISDNQNIEFKIDHYDGSDYAADDYLTKKELDDDRRQAKGEKGKMQTIKDDYQLTYNLDLTDRLAINVVGFHQQTSMQSSSESNNYKDPSHFDDKKKGIKPKIKYYYGENEFAGSSIILGVDYVDNYGYRSSYGGSQFWKKSLGAFAMNSLRFGDFEFNQGIRYEKTDYKIDKTGMMKKLNKKKHENNFAAELSGNYLFSDTGKVYAKIEHGFTTPPTALISDTVPINKFIPHPYFGKMQLTKYALNDLKSENYNTFEIGASEYLFDNTTANVSAFYTLTNDEIHTVMKHSFPMKVTNFNIDKTERYGAEFALTHYLDKLTLSESYQYLQAKIKKGNNRSYNNAGEPITTEKISGNKIDRVPTHKFAINAKYQFTDKFNMSGDVVYTGSSYINANNKGGKSKGYTVANLRASYELQEGIELYAGIDNLFGKKYSYAVDFSRNAYSYYPAPTRNYYAGFRCTF